MPRSRWLREAKSVLIRASLSIIFLCVIFGCRFVVGFFSRLLVPLYLPVFLLSPKLRKEAGPKETRLWLFYRLPTMVVGVMPVILWSLPGACT